MNKEERDALLHKHGPLWDGIPGSKLMCACCRTNYPCDVVRVLVAWRAEPELKEIAERVAADTGKRTPLAEVLETFGEEPEIVVNGKVGRIVWGVPDYLAPKWEEKPKPKHSHAVGVFVQAGNWISFDHCPKCGEKL
jgi:hypothetical protein